MLHDCDTLAPHFQTSLPRAHFSLEIFADFDLLGLNKYIYIFSELNRKRYLKGMIQIFTACCMCSIVETIRSNFHPLQLSQIDGIYLAAPLSSTATRCFSGTSVRTNIGVSMLLTMLAFSIRRRRACASSRESMVPRPAVLLALGSVFLNFGSC